jgi:phage baseplate assembly protein W
VDGVLEDLLPDPEEEVVSPAMPASGDLYGRGLAFPLHVAPDGRLGVTEGEANVRQSMCLVLRTLPGERVMRQRFGCALDRYLFEPNTVTTLRLVQEEVKQALVHWEPRVHLDDVQVVVNQQDQRAVDVTVVYTLVTTGTQDAISMTVPMRA